MKLKKSGILSLPDKVKRFPIWVTCFLVVILLFLFFQQLSGRWVGLVLTPVLLSALGGKKADYNYKNEDLAECNNHSGVPKIDDAQQDRRLSSLYQGIMQLSQMRTEDDLLNKLLALCVEFSGAVGGTYIAYDERKQPVGCFQLGENQNSMLDAYFEYIASPQVRGRCAVCQEKETLRHSCPIIYGLDDLFDKTTQVFCLPIERLGKEYGVINLSYNAPAYPGIQEIEHLKYLARLGAAFLSSLRTFSQVQKAKANLVDVSGEMTDPLLEHVLDLLNNSLNSHFSLLRVRLQANQTIDITVGNVPRNFDKLIDSEWKAVITAYKANGNKVPEKIIHHNIGAVDAYIYPFDLSNGEAFVGLGYTSGNEALLQKIEAILPQIALVVEQILNLRRQHFNAVLAERTRLAREIHDGVAQNLGFLKLKLAQMKKYLEQNKLSELENALLMAYQVAAESYLDVRESIDGLRDDGSEDNFIEWLERYIDGFHQSTGVTTRLITDIEILYISPETHLQLVRIVQEALSNVRKHAQASRVDLLCSLVQDRILLEIKDDGKGFSLDDTDTQYHHGLQGIKERAELVGAEFKIKSRPGEGTSLQLKLHAEKIIYCQ